jgi:uncharacterized protein (TIGR02996 family)
MPRYEFSEGTSNKFWEIELDGSSFTTRYGKIGTDGQETTKDFGGPGEAKKAYDKLVAEKVKKGYEIVEGDGDEDGDDDEDGEAPAGAVNPSLEAAILKDPDNVQNYLVYADWLQTQSDPRGELMAVQAALLGAPGDAKLLKREEELIAAHTGALLGDLAEEDEFHPTWRLGGLGAVTISDTEEEWGELESDAAVTMVKKLFRLPAARLLRELTIGLINDEDGQPDWSAVVGAIAESTVPSSLRVLRISCGGYQISWTQLGDLSKVYPKAPRLEELYIKMGAMDFGKIDLPELRVFEVVTGGFTKGNLKSVLTARWPKLEKLVLYFGDDNYGGDCEIGDLKPILDGKNLANVRTLGLANAQFSNDIAAALPTSKILKQLRVLDLSKGTLDDEGAGHIVEHGAAFKHLEVLDVSENYITDGMLDRLATICKTVKRDGNQGDQDADDRYVQVAE